MSLEKKDEAFWNNAYRISDYLFKTNMTVAEIASVVNETSSYVDWVIGELGLGWVRKRERKLSKGADALTSLFRDLIPGEKIINEFHVGERLMLDVYCPRYKLGAEYHGIQHFQFNTMFHTYKSDFIDGQKRDARKVQLCKDLNIALVVFRYDDELTEDVVCDRIITAMRESTKYDCDTVDDSSNPSFAEVYRESKNKLRREANRRQYAKYKESKKKCR